MIVGGGVVHIVHRVKAPLFLSTVATSVFIVAVGFHLFWWGVSIIEGIMQQSRGVPRAR